MKLLLDNDAIETGFEATATCACGCNFPITANEIEVSEGIANRPCPVCSDKHYKPLSSAM